MGTLWAFGASSKWLVYWDTIGHLPHLEETDLLSALPEAPPAHHEAVLADETVVVSAAAAATGIRTELAGVRVPDGGVTHG